MTTSGQSCALRRMVQRRMPKLIRKAMADYAAFAQQPPPGDAKGFTAHHAACKSALSHLDAAAKLLAWAGSPNNTSDSNRDLARMIMDAEHAIAATDPDSV